VNKQVFISSCRLLILLPVFLILSFPAFAAQTCRDSIILTAPTGRYQVHGNGTVTDLNTGLMWRQCSQGQSGIGCTDGSLTAVTGSIALQEGETLNNSGGFAGYSDWRLPNRKELESTVEEACYSPAINLSIFPNTKNDFYWSSTPAGSGFIWGVAFEDGNSYWPYFNVNLPVRLVRGGQ
jgi:hypothetical protein